MPTFEETRLALGKAKAQQAEAEAVLRKAAATAKLSQRGGLTGNAQAETAARAALTKANAALAKSLSAFQQMADPRREIGNLPDSDPFLLFPVRIETRFKTLESAAGPKPHLLVRIYPDSCLIDSFEEQLSVAELATAKAYWSEHWRADGDFAKERAAFGLLVESHGGGRARWIVRQYRPLNFAEKPSLKDGAAVLVIATNAPPTDDEQSAIGEYWRLIWQARGDSQKQALAEQFLIDKLGAARAEKLKATHVPFNLADQPVADPPPANPVRVHFLILPPDPPVKAASWGTAPRADPMPDRFVLVLRSAGASRDVLGEPVRVPLFAGFDPSGVTGGIPTGKNGVLEFPEETRWMADFDEAVKAGMGFRIELSAAEASQGFKRIYAIGLSLSEDAAGGRKRLEQFVEHRLHSGAGFDIVPQGTPTNNTEEKDSGYSRRDDADRIFEALQGDGLYKETGAAEEKTDGQLLAEGLGLDHAIVKRVLNADSRDHIVATAVNTALWPATLGYFMSDLLTPVFDRTTVRRTREHFIRHVGGHGTLPAVRVGRQPYGILPVTAFDRIAWLGPGSTHPKHNAFLSQMLPLLDVMNKRWMAFADSVAHTGKAGDVDEVLLDILRLHPSSVEFHYRYAQSFVQISNFLRVAGVDFGLLDEPKAMSAGVLDVLKQLGYSRTDVPRLAAMVFQNGQGILDGGLVYSQPPGVDFETEHQRYANWLGELATKSVEDLRLQASPPDRRPPRALLYILLRHALLLSYSEAAAETHLRLAGFGEAQMRLLQREEPMPHVRRVRPGTLVSESKWEVLYKVDPNLTEGRQLPVGAYLAENFFKANEMKYLRRQLDALKQIAAAPREQVERAFRSHVDLGTYRLDAWQLSVPRAQLDRMERKGIYLGAFGWLHDVVPEPRILNLEKRPDAERALLDPDKTLPELMRDSSNGGLMQAPSLNHAVTAAILRNAYMSAEDTAEQEARGINLSSKRVRNALALADGMRMGQSLNALLGYRFERGLHDRDDVPGTEQFLQTLRQMFPLAADRLKDTAADGTEDGAVAARNVVDGLKIVQQMRSSGVRSYPFGLQPPAGSQPSSAQRLVIDEEAQKLKDLHDGLGDLVLSEAVHQSVMGNFDRVASSLDAFSKGEAPSEPDVVRTPSSGISITHRVAVHLDVAAAAAPASPPRVVAEPALDAWLEASLPTFDTVCCKVSIETPGVQNIAPVFVTLANLGVSPLDLALDWEDSLHDGFAGLDDRIVEHVIASSPALLRTDSALRIDFMEKPPGGVSMFEVAALVRALSSLVKQSRALRPADLMVDASATLDVEQAILPDAAGVGLAHDMLKQLVSDIKDAVDAAETVMAADVAPHDSALAAVDSLMARSCALLVRAATFGLPQSKPGRFRDAARRVFAAVVALISKLIADWNARLKGCDLELAKLPGVDDAASIAILRRAEVFLPVQQASLQTGVAFLQANVSAARNTLISEQSAFTSLVGTTDGNIETLVLTFERLVSESQFKVSAETLKPRQETAAFVAEMAAGLSALHAVANKRQSDAKALLDAAALLSNGPERAIKIEAAAQAMFGENFKLVPRFVLPPQAATSFGNSLKASQNGEIFTYLTQDKKMAFPVDEWLHGMARVRANMRSLESATLLTEAFGTGAPELTALQLPHRSNDRWLGLDFPHDYDIDGARLLYSAHLSTPLAADGTFCGLLLDEWTEVIPGARLEAGMEEQSVHSATTGVSFHFDRPNAEAPQTWLLVTPATWNGKWQWQDIVGALDWTWDMMRNRAVDPTHIADDSLSQLLPATVMAAAQRDVTISAVLAANINVEEQMGN